MVSSKFFRIASAKINLDLLVTGRRDDGYHLLDSLVVFAEYGDEISASPSQDLSLTITGPFADALSQEKDNIVLKAAKLLQDKFDIQQGAEIELVKNLPVSSGIGGGSADAAAVILALQELWNITSDLAELPLSLGADVPVCMASETMQMAGVGEILRPVILTFPLYMLLVNPGVSVSTAGIFRARADRNAAFSPGRNLPGEITSFAQLKDITEKSGNDLEYDACKAAPEIQETLAQIRKSNECLGVGMSGSGATCFGIFPSIESADRLASSFARDYLDWWTRSVRVR